MSSCPLCEGRRLRPFPIHYVFRDRRFDAHRCRDCGFIFLLPTLTREDLAVLYSDEYFLHDGADFGAHSMTDYETAARAGSVKFPVILGQIRRFRPSGRFLEIGCGMGYFLDYVRSQGYEVNGIEYAALGTRTAREKFGLDVQQCSLEDYDGPPESFDVVFLGDVLEHLLEPVAMLQKIHRLLRPEGIVAAEVPSIFNSLVGRGATVAYGLTGRSRRMPMPPYHVSEFLPGTLHAMLQRAGFPRTHVHQRAKPPSTIALRGSAFDKLAKRTLQYPNFALTRLFGVFGDRLLGIGEKPA